MIDQVRGAVAAKGDKEEEHKRCGKCPLLFKAAGSTQAVSRAHTLMILLG